MLARSALGLALLALVLPASATAKAPEIQNYVVRLAAPPVASYAGGTAGLPATSPRALGARSLDLRSSAVARYRSHLDGLERRALDRVPGPAPDVAYEYRLAFPGFSATLDARQAAQLRAAPEVASVEVAQIDTLDEGDDVLGGSDPLTPWLGGDSASWLRLTAPTGEDGGGLWSRIGSPTSARGPGAGMVIAVLDGGVMETNPSFAATPGGGAYLGEPFGPKPASYTGACTITGVFTGCSDKIVGASFFVDGIRTTSTLAASEGTPSARDVAGHGSHTASTAAGNYGVRTLGGTTAAISGIAPRAQIGVYKVCWLTTQQPQGGCSAADTIAAIERAVQDGADVITHSITGGTAMGSPKALAFLGAYDAGVFVSTSAGNTGAAAGTMTATPSPWTTVVGASTTNRRFSGTLTVTQNGAGTFTGLTRTRGLPSSPLVDAEDTAIAGTQPSVSRYCPPGSLDPAKVAGKLVICLRGSGVARLDKARTVQDAGGVGMVLANETDAEQLIADPYAIPALNITRADGATLKSAVGANGSVAALTVKRDAAVPADGATPRIAGFSSRGPYPTAVDLPGPAVTAPGVNVLAAVASGPAAWDFDSGTSMSTPIVGGTALLLAQRHPKWTPEQIGSALALTASPVKLEAGDGVADATKAGAGQIDPQRADDPGLVVTPTRASLQRLLTDPDGAGGLNLPAVLSWEGGGRKSASRRFTSVDDAAHTWTIGADAAAGTTLTTNPPAGTQIRLAPCATTSVAVTAARTTAPLDTPATGGVTLTDEGGRVVRLPVTLRPTALDIPDARTIRTQATSIAEPFDVSVGQGGPVSLRAAFAAPVSSTRTVTQTTNPGDPKADANAVRVPLAGGASGAVLQAQTSNATNPAADVDLHLYATAGNAPNGAPTGNPVASSSSLTADETVTFRAPPGANHVLVVTGYSGSTDVTLRTWNTAPATSAPVEGIPDGTTAAVGDVLPATLETSGLTGPGPFVGYVTAHTSASAATPPVDTMAVAITRDAAPAPVPSTERPPVALCTTPDPTTVPPATDAGAGTITSPPPVVAPPAPTPAPKVPVPSRTAPKLTLTKLGVSRSRKALSVTLKGSEAGSVTFAVRKGRRTTKVKRAQRVTAAARKLTVALPRRLAKGRYALVVTVRTADGRTATLTRAFRVR